MAKRVKSPAVASHTRGAAPGRPLVRGRLRWWIACGAIAGIALAAWYGLSATPRLAVTRALEQNVLLITIDTLRADALGCYGGRAGTPNLDQLAAEGGRFDFAHAHAVVTLPSHASILTGLYPFQHGVRDNSGYRLPSTVTTLASRLKDRGFATAAFIGGFPLDSRFGLDAGFDLYDDRLNETAESSDFTLAERPADAVVRSAIDWLAAQRSRWFAWVHVFDPHAPYRPLAPFAARYPSDPYAGEVAFVDAALGPLLDRVRAASGRPTVVIVTSDHGEGLGDHGEATHGVFAYEATLRVPLILAQLGADRPAGSRRRGVVSSAPVQHVDIVPTVLGALALPADPSAPGRSLLDPVADAEARAAYFEALSPSLNRGWAPLHGTLVGREKFIDLPLPELYDLDRDRAERTNLADTEPTRRQVLAARLRDFGSTAPKARVTEEADTAARLRSLGYTSGSPSTAGKIYSENDDPKRLIDLDQAMHRGFELFQAGRRGEAVEIYRDVIRRRPDMAIAYLHLSFLLWDLSDVPAAIATLRAARAKVGPDTEVDWRLGQYLSETGRLDEALPLLEETARRPDAGVDALNALGICYARMGRSTLALDTFQQILLMDTRNAMALQNIGSVHLRDGRNDAARRAFEQSIAVNPDWAASYGGLGVVELRSGNRQGAIAAWTRAVMLNPSDFDALFNLATELVNDGQASAARPHVERFVRTAPPAFYAKDIARLRAWLDRSR